MAMIGSFGDDFSFYPVYTAWSRHVSHGSKIHCFALLQLGAPIQIFLHLHGNFLIVKFVQLNNSYTSLRFEFKIVINFTFR